MQRVLKSDGLLVEKVNAEGKGEPVTPADLREMKDYVTANRTLTTPFDIVVHGKTFGLSQSQAQQQILAWEEAGATWWVEDLYTESVDRAGGASSKDLRS